MKILKTVLIILLLGIVIFGIIAYVTPPISNSTNINIDKPDFVIYGVLSNQSTMTFWVPGLKTVKNVEGVANTLGNVSEFMFEVEGYNIPILVEIVKMVNGELIEYSLNHKDISSRITFEISSLGQKSKLNISYLVEPNNFLTKFAFPLFKPIMNKYILENEEELVNLLKNI